MLLTLASLSEVAMARMFPGDKLHVELGALADEFEISLVAQTLRDNPIHRVRTRWQGRVRMRLHRERDDLPGHWAWRGCSEAAIALAFNGPIYRGETSDAV